MSPQEEPPLASGAAPKAWKSFAFLGVLAAVVGTFVFLSSLESPPDLPRDETHRFRFNTEGALVGLALEAGADAPDVEHVSGLELDKKAVESRVNSVCIRCHAAPGQDLTGHPCQEIGKCTGPAHPPKDTCIKCHRH